jgi:plastocyanin
MILIALVAAANPVDGPATGDMNGTPAVHLASVAFTTNIVLVPTGDRLTLVDDDGMRHLIRNGVWSSSGTPQPRVEPGAPVVNQDITSGSATVGPFTTPGVYHLYCVIHRGMNLTVVVQ